MTKNELNAELEQLVTEAANLDAEVRRTHETLWKLLGRCYKLLHTVEADETQFKALCAFATKHDIKTRKTTSKAGLLVRVVFGKKYEHIFACSQTLRVMRARNIPVEDFVEWLEQNGGVNKVRRMPLDPNTKKEPVPTLHDKARKAKECLKKQTAKAKITCSGDLSEVDGLALAVLRKNAHGEVEIVEVVASEDTMITAWAAIGVELKYDDPATETAAGSSRVDVIGAAVANAIAAKEAA